MRELRVLILGFGSFPGTRFNTSALLAAQTARRLRSSSRVSATAEILPVSWRSVSGRLAALIQQNRPDAVFLFGVAGRRRYFSIETRALNRRSRWRPDADGRRASGGEARWRGPWSMRARAPTARLLAGLRRRGLPARFSNDAGDYLCNAAFYHALEQRLGLVAFIHVPRMADPFAPLARARSGLMRPTIAEGAAALADCLRALVPDVASSRLDSKDG